MPEVTKIGTELQSIFRELNLGLFSGIRGCKYTLEHKVCVQCKTCSTGRLFSCSIVKG